MSTLLNAVLFLPLAGALAAVFLPRGEGAQHKTWALLVSLVNFFLSLGLWFNFDASRGAPEFQFETSVPWISSLGISYHVGLDGVALLLVMLTTALSPIVILSAWKEVEEHVKEFYIALLVLETAMIGTFAALDLVLFYVFYEAILVPMYLLIGVWGSENRIYATVKFFVYTFAASVLMLVAILFVYFHDGGTFDYVAARQGLQVTPAAARWLFWAFALAFMVKVPMFPLHTWLPDAHTAAPTVGSVLLAAILLKLGAYGFIRVALPILPEEARQWAPAIAILAVIAIIYGSLACLAQTDMKRLIAFSSVGHMGFVMLGISTFTDVGINAAIVGMVAHGVITGLLFFLAGSIQHRYHTREMARLGGNQKVLPILGGILAFAAIASLGLPGLAGFWGEFMALLGSFHPFAGANLALFRTAMVLGSVGTVLTAGYLLWMLQRVNLGEVPEEWREKPFHDADRFELAAWVPLVLATLAIGVYPALVFGATNDSVALLARVFGG